MSRNIDSQMAEGIKLLLYPLPFALVVNKERGALQRPEEDTDLGLRKKKIFHKAFEEQL